MTLFQSLNNSDHVDMMISPEKIFPDEVLDVRNVVYNFVEQLVYGKKKMSLVGT